MRMTRGWFGPLLAASVVLGLIASCGGGETTSGTGPCPNGICGSGGSSGPGGGGGGTTCAWACSPWDTQGNGDAGTRTCVDVDGCADPNLKPAESAMLPGLDENFYRCNVEPVFDKYCAQNACHGTEPDLANGNPGRALRTYARGRLRITGETWTEPGCLTAGMMYPSEDCIASIECLCWTLPHSVAEWQRNFDAARGLALKPDAAPLDSPADSEILTQPLRGGGLPHAGIKIWDTASTEYQVVHDWLSGMTLATCNSTN